MKGFIITMACAGKVRGIIGLKMVPARGLRAAELTKKEGKTECCAIAVLNVFHFRYAWCNNLTFIFEF